MKKLFLFYFLLLQTCLCQAQTTNINGIIYTVSDGGGKNFSGTIVPKSNTIYQNYVFVKGFLMFSNGAAVNNVKVLNNTFNGVPGTMIFFGSYAGGSQCSNIEVAYNTMYGSTDSTQYRWEFQNCVSLNVHNNYIHDMIGKFDGGIFYIQYSQFNIHNNYMDRVHGKCFRLWPAKNSLDTVINNALLNTDMYSGTELQEVTGYLGLNTGWNVFYSNNTGGNYIPSNGAATAAITLYFPGDTTVKYQFLHNVVWNTSAGLLDNSGTSLLPWAPINSNWKTTNTYYATQAAAGFATDSVKLPDGTNWNGSTTTLPPVANAGANQNINVVMVPTSIILNGSQSTGNGLAYNWKQLSGPTTGLMLTNGVLASVGGLQVGVYTFQLTVTDISGRTSTSNCTVTVNLIACPVCPICPIIVPRTITSFTYDSVKGWNFIFSDGGTQTISN